MKIIRVFSVIILLNIVTASQVLDFSVPPELRDEQVAQLVSFFKVQSVKELKQQFKMIRADQSVELSIANLPSEWMKFRKSFIQVPEADRRLWKIGKLAVKITNNPDYEFVYLDNDTPLIVSDSNCVLVITKGMLSLTEGKDDMLLGAIIHEFAHGLFAESSVRTKIEFNQAIKDKRWIDADEKRKQLALIEIQCDLIAAKFLLDAGYNLNNFAKMQIILADLEKKLQVNRPVQWHPVPKIREAAILKLSVD